ADNKELGATRSELSGYSVGRRSHKKSDRPLEIVTHRTRCTTFSQRHRYMRHRQLSETGYGPTGNCQTHYSSHHNSPPAVYSPASSCILHHAHSSYRSHRADTFYGS